MQPDMSQMMQAVAKAQRDMAKAQEELQNATVDGQAGGGAVTVTITGDFVFKKVKIKPEAVDASDIGMLEDLLLTALNDACQKSKDVQSQKMSKIMPAMPPGMGF
ncbi:MAG: YbaB/EbfC family nucleoid-associated protein [Cyanobacteria bacterium REEB67]|nr:YbaB/EbfC family nucleoid-associated protein [Cyanobacteria bacterium REEB67]